MKDFLAIAQSLEKLKYRDGEKERRNVSIER